MLTKLRKGSQFLEYAMLAALIGIAVSLGAMRYGHKLVALFDALGEKAADVTPKTETKK